MDRSRWVRIDSLSHTQIDDKLKIDKCIMKSVTRHMQTGKYVVRRKVR